MARKNSLDLLEQKPYPELAAALRSRIDPILKIWMEQVRKLLPGTQSLTHEQLLDNLPNITSQIAALLESGSDDAKRKLRQESPAQGLARFQQNYNIHELMS